jgi:hypothetical protein
MGKRREQPPEASGGFQMNIIKCIMLKESDRLLSDTLQMFGKSFRRDKSG